MFETIRVGANSTVTGYKPALVAIGRMESTGCDVYVDDPIGPAHREHRVWFVYRDHTMLVRVAELQRRTDLFARTALHLFVLAARIDPSARRALVEACGCLDCGGARPFSDLICDGCRATGPVGPGRCNTYECFALADGWGCCGICRARKVAAIATEARHAAA